MSAVWPDGMLISDWHGLKPLRNAETNENKWVLLTAKLLE
jgi:hypothetical protein